MPTTILVVEDETDLLEHIADTLSLQEYRVITAKHGREGIDLARKHLPDLIISDIIMPELDGYGLLLALREDESTASIPFIFLTGKNDYNDLRKGMTFGADDYVIKPFRTNELLDSVRTRLEKHAEVNRRVEQQIKALRHSVVSTLPHELRTPLTGIMGYTTMLLNGFETMEPAQVRRMLGSVQRSADRLYRMIHNYLLFVQLEIIGVEQERLDLLAKYQDMQPSDPTVVIPSVVQDKTVQHKREGDFKMQVAPASLRILAEDLHKIVEEIIDNACKFSSPGTTINLTTQIKGNSYEICVTDQGRGLKPEEIKQIGGMRQFSRDIYEQQGAGLGLIIARRLTEIYGGELSVESESEQGTSICVKLVVM
jgi:two-component system, sensor histidine kinase and response regulator